MSENKQPEIKCCPFCGSDANWGIDSETGLEFVGCDSCEVWMFADNGKTLELILERWNDRVTDNE